MATEYIDGTIGDAKPFDILNNKVKELESIKSNGIIEMPTPSEIKAITGALDLLFDKQSDRRL